MWFLLAFTLVINSATSESDALFLTKCDSTDPHQKWIGDTFLSLEEGASYSRITNFATKQCLSSDLNSDPAMTADCDTSPSKWFYNGTNSTLSSANPHVCLDAHAGRGPEMDLWTCHEEDNYDHFNQMLTYDKSTQQLKTIEGVGNCNSQCVTVLSPDHSKPIDGEKSCSSTAALTLLPQDRENLSASLDGSPMGLYLVASRSNSTRWTIFLEGGGWCFSDEDCLIRTTTPNGSSKKLPLTRNCQCYNTDGDALFQDCNCLYLPYMDGASFSGFLANPVSVLNETSGQNELLYYRGIKNLDESLNFALENGLREATEVVVSGGSAGGLSTFLHADRIGARIRKETNVAHEVHFWAAPDVGFFLDHEDFNHNGSKPFTDDCLNLATMVNMTFDEDGGLMEQCKDALVSRSMDPRLCFMAEHVVEFVETPLFFFNSKFDSFQLANILGANDFSNETQRESSSQYGEDFLRQIGPALADEKKNNGCFITSCICHGCPWGALELSGLSAYQHYALWVEDTIFGRTTNTSKGHVSIDESVQQNGGDNAPASAGFQKCDPFE